MGELTVTFQVPSTANDDLGLLLFVVDNYRRNGFAVAVQASDPAEAGALQVWPVEA